MITTLIDAGDVLAATVSGQLTKADIEQVMRQLDAAFERAEKIHIFVEVRDFEGMPLDAWLSDAWHGFKYLTHLKQFGRIAIVSDQSWIRTVSRIESALLPFVKYEVYTLDQREHALAWVKGETSAARPEALHILSNGDAGIFAFEVDGRITPENIAALQSHLSPLVQDGRPLKLLGRIRRYDGFDPAILVDFQYLELKLSLLRSASHYAVVGGPEWMARTIALMAPLLRMELRHFAEADEEAARAWLLMASGSA